MTAKKRFISILSDFGFKRIFGNETDTRFLRKALQVLIKSDVPISEVEFDNTVYQGTSEATRGSIVDLSCKDDNGRVFIVEMQRRNLNFFIHRTKFYSFMRLNRMVKKGEYRFSDLNPIYIISFLDGQTYATKEFHQFGCLRNQHGELMDDQITQVVIELGKWNKTEHEVESDLDKILLLMKYTETATINDPIPKVLTDTEWMSHVFRLLEEENLTIDERYAYEMELAKVGSIVGADELKDKEVAEAKQEAQKSEQKAQKSEQKAQKSKQEAQEAKQKAQEAEQKAREAEQKVSSGIMGLLQSGTFTDEKIADLLSVSIEQVRQIKAGLKN